MTHSVPTRPLVSLIVPAYNEVDHAEVIVAFYREIISAYADHDFEMIIVDDGSNDGTADKILGLGNAGERITVASLSRNFGSHSAVSAGLTLAQGDAAITLSADRQEPLEAIGLFLDQWHAGADLVWGLRKVRVQQRGAGSIFSRIFSSAFNGASEVPTYPAEGPSQILATRPVIDVLNSLPESNRNILALAAWTGFDQRRVSYDQLPRSHGRSKWTFQMKLKMVMDSFVEFSRTPLRWVAGGGVVLAAIALVVFLMALVQALTAPGGGGIAAVCGTVLLVGGLNMLAIGVLGEYTWRAGSDARKRPVFILKDVRSTGADA